MLRIGVSVAFAEDQTSMGRGRARVSSRDESGREVEQAVPLEPGIVLSVVHFVNLDDGRRLTTERFGETSMELPRTSQRRRGDPRGPTVRRRDG
jgi:hypothetical protein